MSDFEELSRLAEGELTEPEAETLHQRIAEEPELKAAWEALTALPEAFDDLLAEAVPPSLDDLIIGQPPAARRRWPAAVPWLLAAALLLWIVMPRSEQELLLITGTERVSGEMTVLAGSTLVDVDGVVEISVEPSDTLKRAIQSGGEPMNKRDLLTGLAGAAVTVFVLEGSALVWDGGDANATTVSEGETVRFGQPKEEPARRLVALATPENSADDSETLREENADLSMRVKFLERIVDDLQIEYLGEAIDWPDEISEAIEPARFEEEIGDILKDCGAEVEVVDVECSEPPCVAIVRSGGDTAFWQDLPECEAWKSNYGSSVMLHVDGVSCPGGDSEVVGILGPTYDNALGPAENSEEDANRSKRFDARSTEVMTNWECAE